MTKEETILQALKDLKLHESIDIEKGVLFHIKTMRVPGGLRYTEIHFRQKDCVITSTTSEFISIDESFFTYNLDGSEKE